MPPFAVLPDPSTLYLARGNRLRSLAPGHILETYLNFAADVTEAQHEIQAGLAEPALPPLDQMREALANDMPPHRLHGHRSWRSGGDYFKRPSGTLAGRRS